MRLRPANLLLALAAAAALPPAAAFAQRGKASVVELATQVDQVDAQVKNADDNLKVVETQYTERPEPSDEERRARQFSNAEIQYLLGDYPGASVLFYDLVADKRFKGAERYSEALFYLSDALYQQKNYVGAKVYLRELLSLKGPHYKEALARYLEIAGRLNEFAGIDEYINQARKLAGGELPPEVAYVYGKWLFKREDLSADERVARAIRVFTTLAQNPSAPFQLQSAYFLGVGQVKLRNYEAAIAQFQQIASIVPKGEREKKVKELANLSLGRLLYETGKYPAAIDRYQEIPRESEYFVESLYETAWARVKMGEYDRAFNATEVLILIDPDSTVAPEAQVLQGHLLLKLHRYGDATESYNKVINSYAPVRDEIEALLTVNKDPVHYFDDLLAKNERNLDVTSLLPPVALKWATTQREVAEAVQMVNDLESGRRGVQEADEIAQRILRTIDERGLETFPQIQEGYTRADAVDSSLTQIDQALVRIEGYLVEELLSPEERAELDKAKAEQSQLQTKFNSLPTTEKEVEARKKRLQDHVDELDREVFKLGYTIQSYLATVAAVEKWVDDTKLQRKSSQEDEKAFVERIKREVEAITAMQRQHDEIRQKLAEERAGADAAIGGEGVIRTRYEELIRRQHQIIEAAEAKLTADGAQVLGKAHGVRARVEGLRVRLGAAKKKLRDQVAKRGKQIRETVNAEQGLLVGYGKEVSDVSGDARNLVGRIAFDSFKRVRQQFYDLVLKADVGVVDVAFTRKQDKTGQIQKLASQKDRELRALDEEFKEVLKDVD